MKRPHDVPLSTQALQTLKEVWPYKSEWVFPALQSANIVRTWAALRVMSPDGYPIYQQSEQYPGAFAATYFAAGAFFQLDRIATAARGIQVTDYFDRLALDRALDSIGDAERRLTAAMAGNGAAGTPAVEAWVAPRKAEVDRIRMSVHEIANSGLTLSKLSVAASLLGDLCRSG